VPIFEYQCQDCGGVMEFLEKSRGRQRHKCDKCGSGKLEKMLSGFAVGRSAPPPACGMCPGGPCPSGTCPPTCGEL